MSEDDGERTCTICSGLFNMETEGGCEGYIGILPVQFCPTCRVGILDFASQEMPVFDCPHCGKFLG